MGIKTIKINHLKNPLGFMMKEDPVVSFKRTNTELVRIKVPGHYDSGEITEINPVYPLPITLLPRTRYEVWVNDSKAWFETGKMSEEWIGEWITTDCSRVPILGKKIIIEKEITKARLYVGCCGLYRFEINGKKVGKEYLTPYFNSYVDWQQVITHDVTKYLKIGKNILESTLAEGIYKGRFGFDEQTDIYGNTLALIAELHVEYSDGSKEVISTDDSWYGRCSNYETAEIYNGVVVHFNKKSNQKVPVRSLDLDKSKLVDRMSPPVIVKETLQNSQAIITPKGELVIDVGQNMVGWLKINTTLFADKNFKIRFFEVLDPEGNVYTANLRSAKAELVYKTDGLAREFEPEFTFYGFRYAHIDIEGLDEIPLEAFTPCVVYSDMEMTGYIETSNPMVNRLFLNALWGQKGNFVDVPTDCPQRDERLGWTGDAQVFAGTAYFNMDCAGFFAKYMEDMWHEQQAREGGVPHFIPSLRKEKSKSGSSAAWGDAATIIPWTTYMHTGDKYLLARQYPNMKAWVEYIRRQERGNYLWDTGFHFADWLALDSARPEKPVGTTPSYMVASAYYLYSTELTAKAADELGYVEDAKNYREHAQKIRKAIQDEFITPNGRIGSDTQTANVIALFMEFATDKEKAAAMLNEKIINNDGYLNTGFVGTAYINRVLSDYGFNDTAYKLLLNRDYPGWLYTVERGATTIWERWNSIKPDGSLGDVSMNSFNHYAYGAVMEWMYRNAAGLQPLTAGFKKIRLAPQPNPRLEWLKVSYESPFGIYRSEWKISKEGIAFIFEIPIGCEAELVLPDAPDDLVENGKILTAGTYQFNYQPTKTYFIEYHLDSPAMEIFEREHLKRWLNENIVGFKELSHIAFIRPFVGSLREFLTAQKIEINKVTEEKLKQEWKQVYSWDN